jgi:hypothetical protein
MSATNVYLLVCSSVLSRYILDEFKNLYTSSLEIIDHQALNIFHVLIERRDALADRI